MGSGAKRRFDTLQPPQHFNAALQCPEALLRDLRIKGRLRPFALCFAEHEQIFETY
jgi:hypothetical protein